MGSWEDFGVVSGSEELAILEGVALGCYFGFRWMEGDFRVGFGCGRKCCVAGR